MAMCQCCHPYRLPADLIEPLRDFTDQLLDSGDAPDDALKHDQALTLKGPNRLVWVSTRETNRFTELRDATVNVGKIADVFANLEATPTST